MLHDILDDDHIHWFPPLIRHYTNFWPLLIWTSLLNLTFYLIMQDFHRTFATSAACLPNRVLHKNLVSKLGSTAAEWILPLFDTPYYIELPPYSTKKEIKNWVNSGNRRADPWVRFCKLYNVSVPLMQCLQIYIDIKQNYRQRLNKEVIDWYNAVPPFFSLKFLFCYTFPIFSEILSISIVFLKVLFRNI